MSKNNNRNTTTSDPIVETKDNNSINPFASIPTVSSQSTSRKLDFTPVLQDTAHKKAVEFVQLIGSSRIDLAEQVNTMLDSGDPAKLIELFENVFGIEAIAQDANVLNGCSEDELKKMFESQRSNRSRAKRSGLRKKLEYAVNFMTAMYAEMMIRVKLDKPYAAQSTGGALDLDELAKDPELLKSKIGSLASKRSRLVKLAEYDADAKTELLSVEADLKSLRSLRPTTTRTVVKDLNVDAVRKALEQIDTSTLPEDQQSKLIELMAKLG